VADLDADPRLGPPKPQFDRRTSEDDGVGDDLRATSDTSAATSVSLHCSAVVVTKLAAE